MYPWGELLAGAGAMGIGILLLLWVFWKAKARVRMAPALGCLGSILVVVVIYCTFPFIRSEAKSLLAAGQISLTIQPAAAIQAPTPSAEPAIFQASTDVPTVPPSAPAAPFIPTFTPGPTTFRPITWMQLVDFLNADHTNWNTYDPVHYNCVDFSVDLVANALKQDIQAWVVAVTFTGNNPDHALVGFKTTDQGIVYIEPQTDNPYWGLAVGKPLCDSWGKYQCMGTVATIQFLQCDHAHYCMDYTP